MLEAYNAVQLGGGRFGRDKTLAKVPERFQWLGIVNDVKEFCKTCDTCQRENKLVLTTLHSDTVTQNSNLCSHSFLRKFEKHKMSCTPSLLNLMCGTQLVWTS